MYYDYLNQIYNILEIQKQLVIAHGKYLDNLTLLDQFCTCHLDIGRGTHKTNAAMSLASNLGNAIIPASMCQFRDMQRRYPHIMYFPKSYVKNQDLVSGNTIKAGNILVADEPSCGEVITRDQIVSFAALLGFKHIVILGR